jgi:hypothetical protein
MPLVTNKEILDPARKKGGWGWNGGIMEYWI